MSWWTSSRHLTSLIVAKAWLHTRNLLVWSNLRISRCKNSLPVMSDTCFPQLPIWQKLVCATLHSLSLTSLVCSRNNYDIELKSTGSAFMPLNIGQLIPWESLRSLAMFNDFCYLFSET